MNAKANPGNDEHWMQKALALALGGRGFVEPNPMVGCVLVDGGQLISTGFHERFGQPHAERNAITAATETGRLDKLQAATAYVTLEPCCHHGKTPPCTDSLIEIGVKRVVVAMLDPYEKVSGQGVAALREAGIEVDVGVMESAALELNAPYVKRIREKRPWVIGKWAMTLDGKIATRSGDSQWISGPQSREVVHQLRGEVDAILVGIGTALADNPLLTARGATPPKRVPLRVVVDSSLQLPLDSHLVDSIDQAPLLVWTGPEACQTKAAELQQHGVTVIRSRSKDANTRLDELLQVLADRYEATNVLVEGGSKVLGSLLELQQLDQCEVFIAPKVIGGQTAPTPIGGTGLDKLAESPQVHLSKVEQIGSDIHSSYRLMWSDE